MYFLKLAESQPSLLPPWRSERNRHGNVTLGAGKPHHLYYDLDKPRERHEIVEKHGGSDFEEQLLMFAELVYKRGPGSEDNISYMRRAALGAYGGTPLLYRIGLSETCVWFGDLRTPYNRKTALDFGDVGAVMVPGRGRNGRPMAMPNSMCLWHGILFSVTFDEGLDADFGTVVNPLVLTAVY
ncbi:copper amine oxidase [Ophiostoma piceae UAMH 11346]|uniref:Copper amine oxidase n=1 Tax=Ophiostoma piceae (strain UAMH 11346) TaxID=1262450 RepID=S3D136_OPHP1|nr:copper amine oxidase [Ophiostoma piceae UAMH 11346]